MARVTRLYMKGVFELCEDSVQTIWRDCQDSVESVYRQSEVFRHSDCTLNVHTFKEIVQTCGHSVQTVCEECPYLVECSDYM